jgi:hypothetical protein
MTARREWRAPPHPMFPSHHIPCHPIQRCTMSQTGPDRNHNSRGFPSQPAPKTHNPNSSHARRWLLLLPMMMAEKRR